jgi:poly(A) polymerase
MDNAYKVINVSAERNADELSKIFCNERGAEGYAKLLQFGFWGPLFYNVVHTTQTYNALLRAKINLAGNKPLAWAIVLRDLNATEARNFLNGLRFDGDTTDEVCWLLSTRGLFENAKTLKGSERMKLIANKYFSNALCFLKANGFDEVETYLMQIRASTPATQIFVEKLVDGHDLIAMGMKPGKEMKAVLETIADEQREGRVTTRNEAFSKAKELIAVKQI